MAIFINKGFTISQKFYVNNSTLHQMTELQEIFDSFACVICYRTYQAPRIPLVICMNHHLICQECLTDLQDSDGFAYYDEQEQEEFILCPICKSYKSLDSILQFKKLFDVQDAVKKVKDREKQYIDQIQELKRQKQKLNDQIKVLKSQKDDKTTKRQQNSKYIQKAKQNIMAILDDLQIDYEKYKKWQNIKVDTQDICIKNNKLSTENIRLRNEISKLLKQSIVIEKQVRRANKNLDTSHSLIRKVVRILFNIDEKQNQWEIWSKKEIDYEETNAMINKYYAKNCRIQKQVEQFDSYTLNKKNPSSLTINVKDCQQQLQQHKKIMQIKEVRDNQYQQSKQRFNLSKYQYAIKKAFVLTQKNAFKKIYQNTMIKNQSKRTLSKMRHEMNKSDLQQPRKLVNTMRKIEKK